jgi:hypothetical protein
MGKKVFFPYQVAELEVAEVAGVRLLAGVDAVVGRQLWTKTFPLLAEIIVSQLKEYISHYMLINIPTHTAGSFCKSTRLETVVPM